MLTDPRRGLPWLLAGGVCVCMLGWAGDAHASGGYGGCWTCGIWLPVGLNAGASIHPGDGTGFLIGGEASVVDLREGPDVTDSGTPVLGGYVDVLRDMRSDTWRLSLGPETVLYPLVGLDAGAVLELGRDEARMGMRLRYFAASFLLTPYVGVEYLFSGADRTLVETGLLLKFPFVLEE